MANIIEQQYLFCFIPLDNTWPYGEFILHRIKPWFDSLTLSAVVNLIIFFCYFLLLRSKSNYNAKRKRSGNYLYKLFEWFEDEAVTTMIFTKQRFFLLYVLIFFFLLKANLFGIVPFSTTVTMFLGVTLFFSITTQVGCIIINIFYRGFSVVGTFCPKGLETGIMVLLVVIELISYLLRILSLAIRLFSNMFAGHCVIKILSFFILIVVPYWIPVVTIYYYFAFFAIFCLEVFVSFLQAYIFVMLVIIYNNLVFDTH